MRSLVFVLLMFLSSAALAQQSVYLGLGLGNFSYSENVDLVLGTVSETTSSKWLFGGFEFNDHFAIEISYGKTDDISDSNTATVPGYGEVTETLLTDFTITGLSAVGQIPFEWGALLGGLGYFSSDSGYFGTASADCCGTVSGGGSISDNGLMALLGVEWRFGRFGTRYGVRLEYDWWDMGGVDATSLGLGFSYGF
jgi:hypothetical protein